MTAPNDRRPPPMRLVPAAGPTGLPFRLADLDELDRMADAEPGGDLIAGLLPASGVCLLVGRPKSVKSKLAVAMGVAVAAGMDFAGQRVEQGTVVFVSLEHGASGWGRTFAQPGGGWASTPRV
jgi:hypothetical protein